MGYFEAKCPACQASDTAARASLLDSLSLHPDPSIAEERETAAALDAIILTTESAHDLQIVTRLGIIAAECVLGMNIFQDIGSAIRDVVGGRNEAYQLQLRNARQNVLAELKREAHKLGAHAVVAIDLDYNEISGGGKSMLFLVASGTAVRLANPSSTTAQ